MCAMAGLHEIRELATPLISASQPAGGTHQQVMSPTLGTAFGYGTNESSATPNPPNSGTEGGLGFASDMAAGRGLEGTGQADTAESGGVQSQASTTTEHGGIPSTPWVHAPVQAPGGSSGLQSSTSMSGTGTERLGREGEALLGGVIAENAPSVEGGFVTPRSEQGMPTIAEMVEGIPGAHQLMSRVGSFFRVARTEVMQVPAVHVTPPRSTTRSTGSPDGPLGSLAVGDGSLGSHGSSPPQVGSHGTPASFAPPPPGGRVPC